MLMYRHGGVYNFDVAIYTPKSLISYLNYGCWSVDVSCPCDDVVSLCEIVSCTWSY